MVRTLADGGSKKAIASKAPRKQLGGGGGGSSSAYNTSSPSSNNPNFGLFNHAKMWPTPTWQKGIGNFFKKSDKPADEETSSSGSSSKSSDGEQMEADDCVIVAGGASGGGSGTSLMGIQRTYSDDEDKENIDPSSSPEQLKPQKNDGERSESSTPSPKVQRKPSGKQKAGRPLNKKPRMVLQADSDYDDDE